MNKTSVLLISDGNLEHFRKCFHSLSASIGPVTDIHVVATNNELFIADQLLKLSPETPSKIHFFGSSHTFGQYSEKTIAEIALLKTQSDTIVFIDTSYTFSPMLVASLGSVSSGLIKSAYVAACKLIPEKPDFFQLMSHAVHKNSTANIFPDSPVSLSLFNPTLFSLCKHTLEALLKADVKEVSSSHESSKLRPVNTNWSHSRDQHWWLSKLLAHSDPVELNFVSEYVLRQQQSQIQQPAYASPQRSSQLAQNVGFA